ncbi:hypothetical protein SAMN05216199_3436 [Pedococcus cremeus]|uniref:Uncharacterized protein n=1 Tax=Pedococcus cremeus TaxID=587636 RepID=A0A1H9X464_9MICO|nr:hypothetical protein [Pedococcus cremeus]SES40986.1 hypothetical protein SAMN05216199_3436 [Pedococcus cremeus]
MAFEFVRGYVQLASGLGELTRARATEAAQGLLSLPAAGEVSKRALQVSEIADQLLEAARANRESLVALIRSEVESALGRADVVQLADFDRARTALAALTREVEDLRDTLLAEASRSPLGRALPGVRPAEEAVTAAGAALTPAVRETVREAVEERQPQAARATAKKATARKTAARKTTAKKAAAKKSTAKKATAKKATATKAATSSTAKKTSARKASATKASASKSTAKRSAAKKSTASKATAKKSTATQSTSTGNGNG